MNTLELNVVILSNEELKKIDGGGFLTLVAGLYAIGQLVGMSYKAGEAIGEAIYHATH
ncbi:MAG: hypothetical protein JKY73_00715 [Lutibacter sp.]|nr:hypothetical protein [Lutibacter sp.]